MNKTASQIGTEVLEKLAVISMEQLRGVSSQAMKRHGVRGAVHVPLDYLRRQVGIQGATHAAPSVLLSEGNLARAMPTSEMREAIQPLMQQRASDPGIGALQRVYPGYQHGVTRTSRHAKKRLGEVLEREMTPQEAHRKTYQMTRTQQGADPENTLMRNIRMTRRVKGPVIQGGSADIGPHLSVGGGEGQAGGPHPTISEMYQEVRNRGGMGSMTPLNPRARAPIVSGGSTYDYARRAGMPVEQFTPTQRETLNRFGLLHEDFERQATNKLREYPDMFQVWGQAPKVRPRTRVSESVLTPEQARAEVGR